MRCQWVVNKLSAYLDGELMKEENRDIRRHLFSCHSCEQEFNNIRALKEMMGKMDAPVFPGTAYRSVSIDEVKKRARITRIKEYLILFFASMVAVSSLFLFFAYFSTQDQYTTASVQSYEDLHKSASGYSFEPVERDHDFEVTTLEFQP